MMHPLRVHRKDGLAGIEQSDPQVQSDAPPPSLELLIRWARIHGLDPTPPAAGRKHIAANEHLAAANGIANPCLRGDYMQISRSALVFDDDSAAASATRRDNYLKKSEKS